MPRPPTSPIVASAVILVAAAAYLAIGPAATERAALPGLEPKEPGSIRVVSWNIEPSKVSSEKGTSDRSVIIAEILGRLHPQAICLQHAVDRDEADGIGRRLGVGWTVASIDVGGAPGSSVILLAPEIQPTRRELVSGASHGNALAYLARTAGGREFVLLCVSADVRGNRRQVDEPAAWLKSAVRGAAVVAVGSSRQAGGPSEFEDASEESVVERFRRRLSGDFVVAAADEGRTSTGPRVNGLFVSSGVASTARASRVVGAVPDDFAHQPLVVDIVP